MVDYGQSLPGSEVTENEPIVFNVSSANGDSAACSTVTVTGYSVDHSAYDAYMYLIETPDKSILHTGDFRGHGYRGNACIPTIKSYVSLIPLLLFIMRQIKPMVCGCIPITNISASN